ncbi:MAG: hypothetical protein GAK40_01398 [Burkholderia plantarii]|nr:MAG: hypothetical protein GAK40_01398 [Burkholderia plantarii]
MIPQRLSVSGHTLIEALVALILASFVLGAALGLYLAQQKAGQAAHDTWQGRDAAATALALLEQPIRMAGFAPLGVSPAASQQPAVFGCAAARPAGSVISPQCDPAAAGSDGLQVSFIGDAISTWPTSAGLVTDCLGQGVAPPASMPRVVNRYFVRPRGASGEPELYCEGNGRSGVAQPLVEGIERLRLRYRLQGATVWLAADAVPRERWGDVSAIEVCVQALAARLARGASYRGCDGETHRARDGRARVIARRWLVLRNAARQDESSA